MMPAIRIATTIECSRCPRTWNDPTKILTLRTLGRLLSSSGWMPDPESPGSWMCPECSEELTPDDRESP